MLNEDGSVNTQHSMNPVPVVVTSAGVSVRDGGALPDVAPTVLKLLGEPQPPEMTGEPLV
jgi:2,3-bisphosphoglycerate-independent phosphoglycerate mutase